MLRKWFRETPKGILVIAASWFLAAGLLLTLWRSIFSDVIKSVASTDAFGDYAGLIVFLNYAPLALWLGFALAALFIAIGLLRSTHSAAFAARNLSIFWAFAMLVIFGSCLADAHERADFRIWCFSALVIAYNLWSYWYLSRTSVQDKLTHDLTLLNLNSH